jgi:ribosomal protein S18 acetylase RimI-like enzyme
MIRDLLREDKASVLELVRATNNFNDAEVAIAEELLDSCLDDPKQQDYFTRVAVDDGQVAGFLIIGPTPATTGTFDMYWIAVHPAFQGRGIAQALDQTAVDFVRERGGYLLIAETSGQPGYDRTRAFYEKQGYGRLAEIPDYYKPGDALVIFGKRVS